MKEVNLDPLVNWAGGKRWLKDVIKAFYIESKKEIMVEPFAGGMAASLHIRPKTAIINDVNKHLINFYRHVGQGLELDFKKYDIADYVSVKSRFNICVDNDETDSEEFALMFYFLMRHSFNAICRYSKKKGHFNVPKGDKSAKIPISLGNYEEVISAWAFLSEDFEDIEIPEDAFVFVDAPYDDTNPSYWHLAFTKFDLKRMVEWAGKLGNPVVLTNSPTDYMIELLTKNNFKFKIITTFQSISAESESRGRKPEVIAWKNIESPKCILDLR